MSYSKLSFKLYIPSFKFIQFIHLIKLNKFIFLSLKKKKTQSIKMKYEIIKDQFSIFFIKISIDFYYNVLLSTKKFSSKYLFRMYWWTMTLRFILSMIWSKLMQVLILNILMTMLALNRSLESHQPNLLFFPILWRPHHFSQPLLIWLLL